MVRLSSAWEVASSPCNFDSTRNFLDCSSRALHHVPIENVDFANAKGIDLSGNNFERIKNETFSQNSALKYLDLSDNGIAHLETGAFRGLGNLAILNLSRNEFEITPDVMTPELFEPLVALKEIRIQNVPTTHKWEGLDQTFGKLMNLTKLYIDFPSEFIFGNEFNNMDIGLNQAINSLHPFQKKSEKREMKEIRLARLNNVTCKKDAQFVTDETALIDRWIVRASKEKPFLLIMDGNPLQCTCDTVLFIRWIENRKDNLDNPENYTCLLSNGSRKAILEFSKRLRNFEVSCVSSTYIIISVVATATISILILLLVIIYRYRLNLRYWLYTRLQPPKDMFAEQEYVFDAFVAYTAEDREWVSQQLRPNLELRENTFKLCIHDRDFTPGKPIHENIVDKMRESRKILLIISQHFLESTYGPLEIEYAGMKCLSDGRDDIILCVLMEDIPVRHMPKALRNLWHKITFLKWSADLEEQVIFWRNLTNALH
ncbi:toll-like receptor 13 [Liolophura sinensis]|uniref:toll-like receptor 13 n=1 Tax=Liolophura sinensis TaxID=3198878 RepID=UPI0031582843